MSTFVIGKDYSREEIHAVCCGNKQSFLPTHHGKVVAACTGAAQRSAGRTLARQGGSIPVFVRQENLRWRFMGDFQVAQALTAPPDCSPYALGSGYKTAQISRILKLRRS